MRGMPALIFDSVKITLKFKSNNQYSKIIKQKYHHMERSNSNSHSAKGDHFTLALHQQGKLGFIMIMEI